MPGFCLNCLLTSSIILWAAFPTADIVRAENKNGNTAPNNIPTRTLITVTSTSLTPACSLNEVKIIAVSALREMIIPGLAAIATPIIIGFTGGPQMLVGLLTGVTVSGVVMAVFMSNAGGAWDNAKKMIEGGVAGGKGSPSHKAAVVGDTVGDPFKDTSGPSINILIKLMSMVSLVIAPMLKAYWG